MKVDVLRYLLVCTGSQRLMEAMIVVVIHSIFGRCIA